jgi:hypothetical protein
MGNSIPVEMFTKEIYDLLDETFRHVPCIYLDGCTSLFEALSAITAEEAPRPTQIHAALHERESWATE